MSNDKAKRKRKAPTIPLSSSPLIVRTGLLDCYNFLLPNEYSEKTFGILAFLLRKSVSDINFSDLIDEAEKLNQKGQTVDYITLLQEKRLSLPDNEVSIEKCLMLTRLITYIKENTTQFMTIIADIRRDMQMKLLDNQLNSPIQYPNDFRQREIDFYKRKNAQDIRYLFYLNHTMAKQPPNLIHLKNRTTEHLSYLLDHRMRYEPQFRDIGRQELFNLFNHSFMIISHPHTGAIPVIIYERMHPGEYTAKVSVIIISLLNDFMRTHPNIIEFIDIKPSLCPSSTYYELKQPESISWKICQLESNSTDKPQLIQFAELTFITIQQAVKTDTHVHFAQALHTLKFTIKFRINLPEYNCQTTHEILLESLPFGIAQHTNQIPNLLTRVILDNIRRFSDNKSINLERIVTFVQCYFLHRTGVKPKQQTVNYLEQELQKALTTRKKFQTLEDIFMDFLVPFIHQVEFMAKHPILAMFYDDGLFLGICNSEQSAEIMKQLADDNSPIVGLRFNSIRVDYNNISEKAVLGRTIKLNACAVRVDIYNNSTKKLQYRTFETSKLINDITKLVSTAYIDDINHVRVLSNFNDKSNVKNYKSFKEFNKYYDKRLYEICKTDEKYQPLTNLMNNIDDENHEERIKNIEIQNYDMYDTSPFSIRSTASIASNHEQNSETNGIHDNVSSPYGSYNNGEALRQRNLSSSNQQENDKLIQHVLSQPDLLAKLIHEISALNLRTSTQPQQLNLPESSMLNQNHQMNLSHNQPIQFLNFQQTTSTMYPQLQEQFTHQQWQTCTQQLPQQQTFPIMNNYQSNSENESQSFSTNPVDIFSQQSSIQNQASQTFDDVLNFITTNQMQYIPSDADFQLCINEFTNDNFPTQNNQ